VKGDQIVLQKTGSKGGEPFVKGDWRRDRIGSALRGENPMVLAKMKSGFAVIGDTQFLPGYCLLLAYPRVE
jgi:hypothetical protein